MDSGKPYIDLEITDEYIIREFGQNIDPIELMWHRDDENRVVEVLNAGDGWKFQFDNEIPFVLDKKISFFIDRHEWHRVIKGKGKLLLKICKK